MILQQQMIEEKLRMAMEEEDRLQREMIVQGKRKYRKDLVKKIAFNIKNKDEIERVNRIKMLNNPNFKKRVPSKEDQTASTLTSSLSLSKVDSILDNIIEPPKNSITLSEIDRIQNDRIDRITQKKRESVMLSKNLLTDIQKGRNPSNSPHSPSPVNFSMGKKTAQEMVEEDIDSDYSFDSDNQQVEKHNVNPFSKLFKGKQRVSNKMFTEALYPKVGLMNEEFKNLIDYLKVPLEINNKYTLSLLRDESHPDYQMDEETPYTRTREINHSTFQLICESFGEPKCMKFTNSMDYIVISFLRKRLILYSMNNREFVDLKTSEMNNVNCIEFSPDDQAMFVGLDSGEIAIYKKVLEKNSQTSYSRELRIKDVNLTNVSIVDIKLMENKKAVIVAGEDGSLFYGQSANGLLVNKWSFKIVDRGTGRFCRSRLDCVVIRNQDYILQTVGHITRFYLHKFEPKFKGLTKITELQCPEGKPYCEESFAYFSEVIDAGYPLKVICVVWGYFICYYPMLMGREGMYLPLGGTIQTNVKILVSSPLDKGLFMLIDDKLAILHYNLQNHTQLEAQSLLKAIDNN